MKLRSSLICACGLVGLGVLFGGPAAARGGAPVVPPAATATPTPDSCGPGTWSARSPYPTRIRTQTVAITDIVYSFGGSVVSGTTASAYRFDPGPDTWTPLAPLPAARSGHSVVTDGTYIYIINGRDASYALTRTVYRYDPAANTYTTLAPAPQATYMQAAVYLDGKIYRLGGLLGGIATASVDVYTVATNTWAPLASVADYPLAAWSLSAVGYGGYIYAAGGNTLGSPNRTHKTYRYDPRNDAWDDAAVPDLAGGRSDAASGILGHRWILAGGLTGYDQILDSVVALDLQNPAAPWVDLPALPAAHSGAMGAVTTSRFFALGGTDTYGMLTADNYQYAPPPCALTPTGTPTGTPATLTATPTPYCSPAWQPLVVPSAATPAGFVGLAGTAPDDLWAVGSTSDPGTGYGGPLAEHWNGDGWTVVPVPTIGAGDALSSVAVRSATDAWAVGPGGPSGLFTAHWDGTAWTSVAGASAPDVGAFQAVAMAGTQDVWAVGYYGTNITQSLTEHWDGRAWHLVPSPNVGTGHNSLYGVTALAPNDVWAVGEASYEPLTLHWNGSQWQVMPSPRLPGSEGYTLFAVAGAASNDIWAAGRYYDNAGTLLMHWDGTQWTTVRDPDLPAASLQSLAVGGPADVWAVGFTTVGWITPITTHWNGSQWTAVPVPYTPYNNTPLWAGAWLGSEVWAAGSVVDSSGVMRPLSARRRLCPGGGATATAPPLSPTFTPSSTPLAPTSTGVVPTASAAAGTATPSRPTATVGPAGTRTGVPPSPTATGTALPAATHTPVPPTSTPPRGTTTRLPAPTTTPCPITFSDVHPSDYFYVPVQFLACHGVISGYANGTFRPYWDTTRAQMVKIVVLGFQTPLRTSTAAGYTFADVPPAFPFFTVIETAAAEHIVNGYTCGAPGEPCDPLGRPYFRPYANVTRGQLAKIDVVAAGWALHTPATPTFTDVAPGSAFYAFVETAICYGVISGYTDHTFRPGTGATRGQIAKIVYLSVTAAGACGGPLAGGPPQLLPQGRR